LIDYVVVTFAPLIMSAYTIRIRVENPSIIVSQAWSDLHLIFDCMHQAFETGSPHSVLKIFKQRI
jgi:hypothetical protein